MGMNPETNKFEKLSRPEFEELNKKLLKAGKVAMKYLLRPDGSQVPKHWTTFQVGEEVDIKNYTFKVAYIGETSILFEPVGLPITGQLGNKDEG